MKSLSSLRTAHPWLPVVAVFVLCLGLRLYRLCHKQQLHGDELTSVCIAYQGTGWGNRHFEYGRLYKGEELQQHFFNDDEGGLQGLWHDLQALHTDNHDASHASLYYMTLRLALCGLHEARLADIITRGGALGLCFFVLSFIALYLLLRQALPRQPSLMAIVLLVALANPAAIDNTLLLREYALAECAATAWMLWCLQFILHPRHTARTWVMGCLTGAVLCSVGYYNILLLLLSMGVIIIVAPSWQRLSRATALALAVLAILCLCTIGYRGYFNFLHDTRTAETGAALCGQQLWQNLHLTVRATARIVLIQALPLPYTLALVIAVVGTSYASGRPTPARAAIWLWRTALLWCVATMYAAPWKEPRYIAPVLPLCLAAAGIVLHTLYRRYRTATLVFMALGTAYALLPLPYHTMRQAQDTWPEATGRVILVAPTTEAAHTMNLLIPHLRASQECVMVHHIQELYDWQTPTAVFFGEPENMEMKQLEKRCKVQGFTPWLNSYIPQ